MIILTVKNMFELATENLIFIAPALLVISSLAFMDSFIDTLFRIVKAARREYKI